jgi:hypothetical protein
MVVLDTTCGALILCGDLKAVGGYDALVEDLYYYIYIYFCFVLYTNDKRNSEEFNEMQI